MQRDEIEILLAAPRGFCAGVDRAIQIVELALARYGRPVYVRHEIVHNRYVVESLERQGAIFVEELHEVPDDALVIFSAHGVPNSVPHEARRRGLRFIDATCPLVSKVHREAERHDAQGRHIVMIGHAGHPEAVGTMGQLPPGAISLVETVEDAEALTPPAGRQLAYITQTTLSIDETAEIVATLQRRFPDMVGPRKEDICYATSNRQRAVKAIAARCDAFVVIGAPNSSNSLRLVELAARSGCPNAMLVQRAGDLDWDVLAGARRVGISAGASAPELLVDEVLAAFRARYRLRVEDVRVAQEDVAFKLPHELRVPA